MLVECYVPSLPVLCSKTTGPNCEKTLFDGYLRLSFMSVLDSNANIAS